MNVMPFVHEGLGNSSYLVELRDGEAALMDPDRSVARYLQAANEQWAYRRVSRPRTITVQEHDYVSNAIRYTTTAAVYDRAAS